MKKSKQTSARPVAMPKQPMPKQTKESRMVAAHKAGRRIFREAVTGELVGVSTKVAEELAKLYATEYEREAFMAGYLGEQSRQRDSQSIEQSA